MNTETDQSGDASLYRQQGFGARLGVSGRLGLLIVDFTVGFADPASFGGGNIAAAIAKTVEVLAQARRRRWPIAHSRIVFADDGSDANVFSAKVPTLLSLTEKSAASATVSELEALSGELVVRKTAPSAFFETALRSWLTQERVRTLLIAGATTSGCVRATVVDATSCGFRPIVLSDCVGDRLIGPHESNLRDMDAKYADVMTFENFLSDLPKDSA